MARTLKDILEAKQSARAALVKLRDDTDARVAAEKRGSWSKEEDAQFARASADYDALVAEEARARKFEELEAGERSKPGREDVPPGRADGGVEVTEETRARAIVGWFAEQSGEGATDEEVEAARAVGLNLRSRVLTIPLARTKQFRRMQGTHRTVFGVERERSLAGAEVRDLSIGSGPAGGYIGAPEEMIRSLEIAMLTHGGIYQRAQVIRTAGANPISWPSADDTDNSGEWLSEAEDATSTSDSTDPTFRKTTWLAHKVSSKPIKISFELLRDAVIDLPSLVGTMLGERIGRSKSTAFATGSGAGKPRGITLDTVLGVTAASASVITTDELLDLIHSVEIARRAGAAFLMHDQTVLHFRKKKDSQNQYIWQPGLIAGAPDTLFTYPVQTCQEIAQIAASAKPVVFGDITAYKVREVGAIRVRRFAELYGETDQEGFIAFHEADGGLLNPGDDPVKHLVMAAS